MGVRGVLPGVLLMEMGLGVSSWMANWWGWAVLKVWARGVAT